jgi:hypothetical protein
MPAERNLGIFRLYLKGRLLPFSSFSGYAGREIIDWVSDALKKWRAENVRTNADLCLYRIVGHIDFTSASLEQLLCAGLHLNSHKEQIDQSDLIAFFDPKKGFMAKSMEGKRSGVLAKDLHEWLKVQRERDGDVVPGTPVICCAQLSSTAAHLHGPVPPTSALDCCSADASRAW